MKLTIVRKDKKNKTYLSTKTLDTFIERIKKDTKNGDVTLFRQYTALGADAANYEREHPLPYIYPLAEMRKTESGCLELVAANELTLLTVTNLGGKHDVEAVKQAAAMMPTTLAAFADSTGRGAVVLVSVASKEGTLPTTEDTLNAFAQAAHRLAASVYGGLLPFAIAQEQVSMQSCFRMTLDDTPYYNPKATALVLQGTFADRDPVATKEDTEDDRWDTYENYEHLYNHAATIAVDATYQLPAEERDTAYLTVLCRQMCQMGVPQEETMAHVWNHYGFATGADRDLLRTILQTVYEENQPDEQRISKMSHEVGMETRRLITFLTTRYLFRFNTVMGYTEYRPNNTWTQPWEPVDDRSVKGITTEARLAGLNAWDRDVARYVQSNLIKRYDPIEEYLWKVHGTWDGQDHIGRLAATVPCNAGQWPRWFRKWLLYMVAQWLGRSHKYGNSVAPLLISQQGNNKSTFCRSLLPDELQWGYTDNLTIEDKRQTLQAMHNMLLINLDEFNQIAPRIQEGFLKNVFQLASVKIKRPYGKHIEDFPRLASFIATTNMPDVLSDPSGSRRFIGIELTGPIDTTYRINHQQLYAQAMQALDDHEQYWFDDAEVREIMAHNRQFRMQSPAEQYFHKLFYLPANDDEGRWMTPTEIFQTLRQEADNTLKAGSLRLFGRVLANMEGLKRRRITSGTQYLVALK